jgi:hypothetical protein
VKKSASAVKLQFVTEEHDLLLDMYRWSSADRHEAPMPLQIDATPYSVCQSLRSPIQTLGFHVAMSAPTFLGRLI